jgi:hypothetical protein
MRTLFARLFAIILLNVGLASITEVAQAQSRQQATQYRNDLVWALEQDAGSWAFNRLDSGSAGQIQKQTEYQPPEVVYRMPYTYNGGRQGWIEGFFLEGKLQSIRYHDNSNWAAIRTEADRRFAEWEAHENMRRNSSSAWCRNLDIC